MHLFKDLILTENELDFFVPSSFQITLPHLSDVSVVQLSKLYPDWIMRMLFASTITAGALGWTSGSRQSSQRGNMFPAAAPDPSFLERRSHRKWTFLGYLKCAFGEMRGSWKNGNRLNWFTYIYVAYSYRNGQSEHNYLVRLEVRKLFLFWITLYVSTTNFHPKHPILYFIFAYALNIWESQEKKMHLCYKGRMKSYTNQ